MASPKQTKSTAGAKASGSSTTPEFPICSQCGSTRIVKDAWAGWNADTQDWELSSVFDFSFCLDCEGEANMEWRTTPLPRPERIARLNDLLRQGHAPNGKIMSTAGMQARGDVFVSNALREVANFHQFGEDNDPHQEHDFGSFEIDGAKLFFKIDYYAPDLKQGSEDPTDPQKTTRVLTIMLAEEY